MLCESRTFRTKRTRLTFCVAGKVHFNHDPSEALGPFVVLVSCPIFSPRLQAEPWKGKECMKKLLKEGLGRGEDFLSRKYTQSVFWRVSFELQENTSETTLTFFEGGCSGAGEGVDVNYQDLNIVQMKVSDCVTLGKLLNPLNLSFLSRKMGWRL